MIACVIKRILKNYIYQKNSFDYFDGWSNLYFLL